MLFPSAHCHISPLGAAGTAAAGTEITVHAEVNTVKTAANARQHLLISRAISEVWTCGRDSS
ncbi:hypothetical protein I545_1772 [Mycobacterium kansasii 662]|uniref:Uncharacterized protein n=1 Tax=Mycobacterium kansasii 662 TaxID=1299326 RepID=X7ZNK0_MYCKA|nr:hypothetical protein I547_3540 [Mycobacterium kansasii 824]EUA20243.1 hypothetical protein I545_1772 [Mycobacterium kansasii 662]KEP39820.1 hypothetical protein MKSMC1_50630 [Mycobacterium kansasii]